MILSGSPSWNHDNWQETFVMSKKNKAKKDRDCFWQQTKQQQKTKYSFGTQVNFFTTFLQKNSIISENALVTLVVFEGRRGDEEQKRRWEICEHHDHTSVEVELLCCSMVLIGA